MLNSKVVEVDSDSKTQNMFVEIALESDSVYNFLEMKLRKHNNLHKICSKFAEKTILVDIEVRDSIIVKSWGWVLEFNDNGDLISYEHGADEFETLFVRENAINFDFIDSYDLSDYNFRVEVKRICKNNIE